MRHQKNHLFLGIFVIAGIFLIAGTVTLLGARAGFREGVAMESYFTEPVTGLDEGSLLRFRGVPIGKVTEITTTGAAYGQSDHNYALVRVEVYPELLGIPAKADIAELLKHRVQHHGLRVQLTETGFTGSAHLNAVYIANPEPKLDFSWKPRTYYVPAATSTLEGFVVSLQAVLNKLKAADIVGVVDAAKRTFGKIDEALLEADVAGLSTKAKEALASLQAQVTELGNRTGGTLDKVDKTLAKADTLLEKPELHKAITNAEAATADFGKLVQRTNRTVLVVQRAVSTRGRDLSAITDGLRELVDNLNSLSGMLERHPSLAVFGKPPKQAPIAPLVPASATAEKSQQPQPKQPQK